MGPVTILFGVLLSVLGGVFFALTGAPTSLIPAYFGIALIVLGVLARNEKLRKHVMHFAVLLGLIGCLMAAGRAITANEPTTASLTELILMAILCGLFTALCVKSFIDARRRRKRSAELTKG